MTDYNDGTWRAWAGGDCPVNQNSIIEAVYVTDSGMKMDFKAPARDKFWDRAFIFRVVEEHKEAREFWIDPVDGQVLDFDPKIGAVFIHVREVAD